VTATTDWVARAEAFAPATTPFVDGAERAAADGAVLLLRSAEPVRRDAASVATPFGGFGDSGGGRDRALQALDASSAPRTTWFAL